MKDYIPKEHTGAEKYWHQKEMERLRAMKHADHVTDLTLIEYADKQIEQIKRHNKHNNVFSLMEGYKTTT